jgi:peptidoglycan/xylan/chitin deacetylase (PgdA/CDA1 family)
VSAAVPILMYHQIAPRPHPGFVKHTVTPKAFARQMGWLARRRYTPIDLDTLLAGRNGTLPLPRRPVVITFDDGYQGCADYAAEVLAHRGFVAVFYVVAGLIGQTSRWLAPIVGAEFPLMGWSTLRALERSGIRYGAHSLSHPRLPQLTPEALHHELVRSREILEDALGHGVRDLAYPFGAFDAGVRQVALEAGYRSACSVVPRLASLADDALALPRVPVSGRDTLLDFACRLRTARRVKDLVRAGLGRIRGTFRPTRSRPSE